MEVLGSHLFCNQSGGSKEQPQTHLSLVALEVDFSTFLLHNPVSLDHLNRNCMLNLMQNLSWNNLTSELPWWIYLGFLLFVELESVIPIWFRFMTAWIFLKTSYFALHRRKKIMVWNDIRMIIYILFRSANPLKQSKQHRFAGGLDLCVCKCMRIWVWVYNLHGFRPGDVFDPLRWIDFNQSVLILLCSFTYLFTYLYLFEHRSLRGILWL